MDVKKQDQKHFWRHYPKKRKYPSGTEKEVTIHPEWTKQRCYNQLSKLNMTEDMYNVAVVGFWEWYNSGDGAGEKNADGWFEIPGGLRVNCDENTGICSVRADIITVNCDENTGVCSVINTKEENRQ